MSKKPHYIFSNGKLIGLAPVEQPDPPLYSMSGRVAPMSDEAKKVYDALFAAATNAAARRMAKD
jgi:hypothetical protein